jgi:polyketide synthase PksN
LLTGDEARDFIAALIKSRQWHKIASIWACGAAIDWTSVHAGATRRRLSLPSYPFESIRCDINAAIAASAATAKRSRERASAASGALGYGDVNQVEEGTIEWFHLPPGTLDNVLPAADFNDTDAGGDWAKKYWLDHLGESADTNRSLTPLLTLDQPESAAAAGPAIQSVSDVLSGALIETLQRCTQTHQVEVETLIVAAWAILVNRYSKARCSQFGVSRALTPVQKLATASSLGSDDAQRPADLTAQLRNLLPVRISTVVREKISQWLGQLQRQLNRKHVYGHIPLQQIENWVGVGNLFDSVIVFQKTARSWASAAGAAAPGGHQLLATEIFASQTRVVMNLTVTIHLDAVELGVLYRSGGPARQRVEMLLEHFKVLLEGLAANPQRNPAALQMRTKTESRETFWKTLERVNR